MSTSLFNYNEFEDDEPYPKQVAQTGKHVFFKFYPPLGPWSDEAACRSSDLNFFPDRGSPIHEQKAVCMSCPCRTDCLEYALEQTIIHGIWGGTSARERRTLRNRRRSPIY